MFPVHSRKGNRLKNYDYSLDNYYFVTICIKNRIECFGDVKDGKMILNQYGQIVEQQWQWLEQQYAYVESDEYIVMPNHLHGILIINSTKILTAGIVGIVEAGRDLPLQSLQSLRQCDDGKNIKIKSLSELIGAFKTTSSKLIHLFGLDGFAWQRSFYDHIIRNEKLLNKIRNYIKINPEKWERDRNNPENILM